MNIQPKTNYLIILGAIVVGLITFVVFMSERNRLKDTSASTAPTVGLLETVGNKLIVHAKSNAPKGTEETFVYCLSRQKSPDACKWDNSDEFDLPEAGDYYVYVKSLATAEVSEPKLFTYEPIDSSKVKM